MVQGMPVPEETFGGTGVVRLSVRGDREDEGRRSLYRFSNKIRIVTEGLKLDVFVYRSLLVPSLDSMTSYIFLDPRFFTPRLPGPSDPTSLRA